MKSLVAGLFISLAAFASHAQSNVWGLTDIRSDNNETVGHIYHIYSKGTTNISGTETSHTAGVRFVCSTKRTETKPIVSIFWNGPALPESVRDMTAMVDYNIVSTEKWSTVGPLIYLPALDAKALISAMKKGRILMFTWVGDNSSKYAVGFDLKDFNLSSFNTSCKTNL